MNIRESVDQFLNDQSLKAENTRAAYARAMHLFLEYLDDTTAPRQLPVQRQFNPPSTAPTSALTRQDEPMLWHFAQWLLDAPRQQKSSTVHHRTIVVRVWMGYAFDYGLLPDKFSVPRSKRVLRLNMGREPKNKAPEPPPHIDQVVVYYDDQTPPPSLRRLDVTERRFIQWNLARLRNRALMYALAESGGRISELLSLNVDDFPPVCFREDGPHSITVQGKGENSYELFFMEALLPIRAYLQARGMPIEGALFVAHRAPYVGKRVTRVTAWRVVTDAARALGVEHIHPHDFRHWRATRYVEDGVPLDVIQELMGHQWVETTRQYYAHTSQQRKVKWFQQTSLFSGASE